MNLRWLPLAFLAASQAAGQPVITAVLHGASSAPALLGVAPGSRVAIWGDNFGEQPSVQIRSYPSGTVTAAEILFASASQVVALVPPDLALGSAELAVTSSSLESRPITIEIVGRRLALFTREGKSFGPALALHPGLNRFDAPARPGDHVTLFGTGLGRSTGGVRLLFAGGSIDPEFLGSDPELPGVDRIDFVLPLNAAAGCLVPFAVEDLEGQGSNSRLYTLSVTPDAARCPPELPLPDEVWEKLDSGSRARIAVLSVEWQTGSNQIPPSIRGEAWTADYTAAELSALAAEDLDTTPAPLYCFTREYRGSRFSGVLNDWRSFVGVYGSRLPGPPAEIRGPNGCRWGSPYPIDHRQILEAPAGCPPLTYRFGSVSGSITAPPLSAVPQIRSQGVGFGRYSLDWLGNDSPTPLHLMYQATISYMFGQFLAGESVCRLSGRIGQGEARVSRVNYGRWSSATKRSVTYQLVGPQPGVDAVLIRLVLQQPVPLFD